MMLHSELVAEIKHQCERRRLPCYDTQEVGWKADAAGWVDLVILGRGAALFVEVKKQDGRRTQRQRDCGNEIAAAGLWYRCWRPSDLDAGIIGRELDYLASEGRAALDAERREAVAKLAGPLPGFRWGAVVPGE